MKCFDVAFSMGFSCGGTMALRRAGLQHVSYPLDWVGAPGIVQSARMIARNFKNWFEKEDLQLVAVRGGSFQNNVYQNRQTRFGFPHDFPRFFRFEDKFDETRAKYDRRITRFLRDLTEAKTALAVYIERPINARVSDVALLEARQILQERFPNVSFDLVYFFLENGERDFVETQVDEGIVAVACDYKQIEYGEISHAIQADVPAAYVRERFKVKDLRSEAERNGYAERLKAERRHRFGGRINELKYRLYRRLEKELQEKGLVPHDFPLWFD